MKPPMDAGRFKQIRERERRATKGPWSVEYANCTSADVKGPVDEDKVHTDYGGRAQYLTEDAEFIAHARQDIPDLLAEVERLRTRVRWLEALSECPDCGQRPGGGG